MLYYEIAAVTHGANRVLQALAGEPISPPWENESELIQESVEDGVLTVLENPGITAEKIHNNWVDFRKSQGWKWGPVKDLDKKEHPDIGPWTALDINAQRKSKVFVAIIMALKETTYDDARVLRGHRNDFTSTRS